MKAKVELQVVNWPVANLIPYELNAKKHDPLQVSKIVASIRAYGWSNPIQIDRDGVIIAGHGRRLAAIDLQRETVPVIVRTDLTPKQVRELRLADNRAAISDFDSDKLREELVDLGIDGLTGIFDAKELDFLEADLGAMREDAFLDLSMDAVLADQKTDLDVRTKEASSPSASVPLARAFGFKSVPASGALAISRLMARAEASTGLSGEAALVAYAEALE